MIVALNGTLVAGRLSWEPFVRVAAAASFDAIDLELPPGRSRVTPPVTTGHEAAAERLRAAGLRVSAIGLPVEVTGPANRFDDDLSRLHRAAEAAIEVGCRRMTTGFQPSSPVPKAELRTLVRRRLRACARVLAEHEVRLGIEFLSPLHLRRRHPYEFIWRMDEMLELAAECGPNVGLLVDAWHWHHAGATANDIRAAGRARIVHVQIADAPGDPPEAIRDDRRLMPGEGVVDLTGFLGALRDVGYDGAVSPEVFGRGLDGMAPGDGARLGLEATLDVMRRAGITRERSS